MTAAELSRTRVYLAGPISLGGTLSAAEVEANRARFRAARERLTADGCEVLAPTATGIDSARSWLDWMRAGLQMLLDADRVVMLPGWQCSRGALIEHRLALELGILVEHYIGEVRSAAAGCEALAVQSAGTPAPSDPELAEVRSAVIAIGEALVSLLSEFNLGGAGRWELGRHLEALRARETGKEDR